MNHKNALELNGVGKCFRINPRQEHAFPRSSLRDTLTDGIKNFWRQKLNVKANTIDFWALRDISLTVSQGCVLGLIGHNGAGKSTLLKVLSRITSPTLGSIRYRGRIATLLEIGTGFHPELTGRENIYLSGAVLGMSAIDIHKRFDDIVAFSELEAFLETPVKRYSSGMYMRLAFGVAAHLRSDVLLVDEVLAVGDSRFQKRCLGKMKHLTEDEGRTVVFVSHNMQAIVGLCTKVALLESGRLRDYGDVRPVVAQYMTTVSSGVQGSKRVWDFTDAPGNDEVKLLSLAVRSAGSRSSIHPSSCDIEVELVFQVLQIVPNFVVGFDLMTHDGAPVLRSYHADMREADWLQAKVGTNVWVCTIPRGLLNGGSFFVCPRIGVHNQYWIVNSDADVRFDVMLDHGVSPLWHSIRENSRFGSIAPVLRWQQAAASADSVD